MENKKNDTIKINNLHDLKLEKQKVKYILMRHEDKLTVRAYGLQQSVVYMMKATAQDLTKKALTFLIMKMFRKKKAR
ncbi:MAG: hypothetical protein ACOCUL_01105 [Bacteroidota bacterium]